MQIPENYRLDQPINHKHYLVNGELIEWKGATSEVYSPISVTSSYQRTLLGSIPDLGETEALNALDAASNAFDNGQGSGLP